VLCFHASLHVYVQAASVNDVVIYPIDFSLIYFVTANSVYIAQLHDSTEYPSFALRGQPIIDFWDTFHSLAIGASISRPSKGTPFSAAHLLNLELNGELLRNWWNCQPVPNHFNVIATDRGALANIYTNVNMLRRK